MPKKLTYQKVTTYEAIKGETKKVVLLHSGSTYTSILIPWLKEEYKTEVITVTIDIGQDVDVDEIKSQSLSLGASKAFVIDAKQEFAKEYLVPALKANVTYQGGYHLLSPLSRPLLAKIAVQVAEREGASAIAHGCPAISNDQIRIDGTVITLNPDLKIIAPLREGNL